MFTKAFRLLGLGVIALSVFSACQREPKVSSKDNPDFDPNSNTVKTKFYLNVSTAASTKTTAAYAQKNGNFLGMEAVHLLTYNLGDQFKPSSPLDVNDKFVFTPFVGTGKVAATKDYDLGTLMSSGDITSENQSRVVELALPLNTNAVAIYGKAYKDRHANADDYQGKVTTVGDPSDLMSLKFGMTPRSSQEEAFDGAAFLFARIFNGIVTAGLVNEVEYFYNPLTNQYFNTSTTLSTPVDRSFHFWWPTGFVPTDNDYLVDTEGYTTDLSGNRIADGTTKTVNNTLYTYHTGELSWKQLGAAYDLEQVSTSTQEEIKALLYNFRTNTSMGLTLVPLLEALGEAYSSLVNIKVSGTLRELRAGSAMSVLRTVEDLYTVVKKISLSTPTSWGEKLAIDLAEEIVRRISTVFNTGGFSYNSLTTVKKALQNCTSSTEWSAMENKIALVTADFFGTNGTLKGVGGFPECIGLPKGAACLTSDRHTAASEIRYVDVFSYIKDIPAYGMGSATFNIFNYVYPAELMYYANSSIRTNDNSVNEWPYLSSSWVTSGLWSADNGWSWPGTVLSTTTSVGVKYPINYGSALCHSYVKYADGVTKMYDNRANLFAGESANEIPVVGSGINTGFEVSGIVIGGQPAAVGWDYTIFADGYDAANYRFEDGVFKGLTYDENNFFNKMIYDKVSPTFRIGDTGSTATNPNNDVYTFCFDNYNPLATAANQSDVYIALELINKTGKDFWGELNLIRKDATFYIVGKVDMQALLTSTASNTATQRLAEIRTQLAACNATNTGYHYPPFNPQTGETIIAPRVFMQDYETVINLILGQNALQHAYVTVPDLSASQVSLGLSVDIDWKSGLIFDVDMGTL